MGETQKITRVQFIQNYIKETGVSNVFRQKMYVTRPCDCGHPKCQGWVHVNNDPMSIFAHELSTDFETEMEGF